MARRGFATGLEYEFIVTTEKADGSDKRMISMKVIALSTAYAWAQIGSHVAAYMRRIGRRVTDVQLETTSQTLRRAPVNGPKRKTPARV